MKKKQQKKINKLKIAIVIPHMFMNSQIMGELIFAPGYLAIDLANGLKKLGHEVTLITSGKVNTNALNITGDLSGIEKELKLRGYGYSELLRKHPLTFISLARQVQNEIVADIFEQANNNKYALVHIFANEEEQALIFERFCHKPVVFTHHEPFHFLPKYRSIFPKYKHLKWISISLSQRKNMPEDTNFVGNVYHGINRNRFFLNNQPNDYFAYMGRIIEPKGVHLAIAAAKNAGVKLKIAGKHYSSSSKSNYWQTKVLPSIDDKQIEFVGFLKTDEEKQKFLGNARALIVPSTWEEPFGMVIIEAMACGTPIIGLNNGSIPELVSSEVGLVARYLKSDENLTIKNLADSVSSIDNVNRSNVRKWFEDNYTDEIMCKNYEKIYYNQI